MSLIYKIEFNSVKSIEEVNDLVSSLNDVLTSLRILLSDFNVEDYEVNKSLKELVKEELMSFNDEKYNFLSGYLNYEGNSDLDKLLKSFRKKVKAYLKNDFKEIYIQEPNGIILDENFVIIPD